ncbi:MAG: hypothetical protein ACR2IT_03725 [Pirellulales bacterium]
MPRPRRNPFYVMLGIVGVVFTITSASYCLSVLRGVRPETAADRGSHPLEKIMDRHGTAILAAELALLAFATVGAIAIDHVEGERIRAARSAGQPADQAIPRRAAAAQPPETGAS